MASPMTREQWLNRLVRMLRSKYNKELPATVHISVGFSSKGLRSKVVGECWNGKCSDDGNPQIFIHPKMDDGIKVAAVVVHELIHACRPTAKHGARFKEMALSLGLTGKMTATKATPELVKELEEIVAKIGPYPQPALNGGVSSSGPKQTTRMIKVECPECGYLVRTTAKWLEVGLPLCPDGDIMFPDIAA
jgi:hypothetical protein